MEISKVLLSEIAQLNLLGATPRAVDYAADDVVESCQDIDESAEIVQSESKKSKKNKQTEATSSASKQGLSCYEHVNESEFKDKIKDSKGTVYLVMGNLPYCGACEMLEKDLKDNKSKLDSVATCYNINWNENNDYCWSLYKELNKNAKSVSFPVVIEFVDGKPVASFYGGSGTAHTKAVKRMISDAKANNSADEAKNNTKNISDTNNTNDINNDVEDCPECQVKADDETQNEGKVKEDSAQSVMKQKLEALKENLNITKNLVQTITSDSLQNAIESASSIDELKTAVSTYSSGLDFSTQINLTSVTNSLTSDSDLDKAKEKILELL